MKNLANHESQYYMQDGNWKDLDLNSVQTVFLPTAL